MYIYTYIYYIIHCIFVDFFSGAAPLPTSPYKLLAKSAPPTLQLPNTLPLLTLVLPTVTLLQSPLLKNQSRQQYV